MSDDRPTWIPLNLICRDCGQTWTDWQPSNVRIRVWIAVVDLIQCPKCHLGIDQIFVQQNPKSAGFSEDP